MFPTINHIDDLLPFVQDNKQIRVKVEPNGMTIVCYMVQDEDTFTGAHANFERECRGITFGPDGRVASRTMHKFFNIGQTDAVRPENIDWHRVVRIMDKRDGSMVTPIIVHDRIKFKTKKSFDTKEAALADQIAANTPRGVEWIKTILHMGLTPTFEVTSPKYPIVLKYAKDELTLLHIRENDTGRYLTEAEMQILAPIYGHMFPVAENVIDKFSWMMADAGVPFTREVQWGMLKHAAETTEGVEGWVIQFDDGEMVKLKTTWYCALHHSVTFTRWRDIARSVVADQSDDLKSAFALTGRSIQPILEVEFKIKQRIEFAREAAQQIVDAMAAGGVTDAKGLALALNKHEHFGLIMRVFRKQDIDWMAWYEKTYLDADWSLEVVGEQA